MAATVYSRRSRGAGKTRDGRVFMVWPEFRGRFARNPFYDIDYELVPWYRQAVEEAGRPYEGNEVRICFHASTARRCMLRCLPMCLRRFLLGRIIMSSEAAKPQKTVLLGVTGGIAAYKILRDRPRPSKGWRACESIMTEHATHFVDPVTFDRLPTRGGGRPVRRPYRSHSSHLAC